MHPNIDENVVRDFGKEWSRFDQSDVSRDELATGFQKYFSIFPWDKLPHHPEGFDLGCGSGRWAQFCAPRVGKLHCIDPSASALEVAQKNLSGLSNCFFHNASVDGIPLEDNTMDFGYSLGVLHHVPDTQAGIKSCVDTLKPGAPFLLYLYYAFDNRPAWYRVLWRVSDVLRRGISRLPFAAKYAISQAIAFYVYLPLVLTARWCHRHGISSSNLPLSTYRDFSWYTMRTDALDRFGTRLEKRFTKRQMEAIMAGAGLEDIGFSDREPYWCAVGYKARRR